jgi:hypothetical protein
MFLGSFPVSTFPDDRLPFLLQRRMAALSSLIRSPFIQQHSIPGTTDAGVGKEKQPSEAGTMTATEGRGRRTGKVLAEAQALAGGDIVRADGGIAREH